MKSLILSLVSLSFLVSTAMPPALAVKTAIEASGNVAMNGALRAYQDNVLQVVTKECLAQKAAKETVVSLTVDPHGNIMRVVLTNSGLSSDGVKQTISALQALKLGDAGENQSDTLRITFDFDLAEVLAGAKSTGTSISIHGGSITGDGTATGGIRIGGGGSIIANGGSISIGNGGSITSNGSITIGGNPSTSIGQVLPNSGAIVQVRPPVSPEALSRLEELEKTPTSNPLELCNARLAIVQQYQRAGDFAKAKEVLLQALKYLEGPAGPVKNNTARDLHRIGQALVSNQTAVDDGLLRRVYELLEGKTAGGCGSNELTTLIRISTNAGQADKTASVASILSRLLEIRETREGNDSPTLVPILIGLAKVNESLHKYDIALTAQQRLVTIQQKAPKGTDLETTNILTLARLYVLNGRFAEATTYKNKVLAIAAQSETSDTQKSSISDGLGNLASAYIEQGAQPDEAISLLEFLLEKPKVGMPPLQVNTWRYQLAKLYLDKSHIAAKKSGHNSKIAKGLQNKSKVYFDTAQNVAPAAFDQLTHKFVQERIDALRRYDMTKAADELQAEQNAAAPAKE